MGDGSCDRIYRAVLYEDFVTIFRGASMQYITKLATKSETSVTPPLNYNIMYPFHAHMRTVKISPAHKILLMGPWAECTAL
jgi:hypothetical protein